MAKEPDEHGLDEVRKLLRQLEDSSADSPAPAPTALRPLRDRVAPGEPAPPLAVLQPRATRLVAEDRDLAAALPVTAPKPMLPAPPVAGPARTSPIMVGLGVIATAAAAIGGGYLALQKRTGEPVSVERAGSAGKERPTLADTRSVPASTPAAEPAPPPPRAEAPSHPKPAAPEAVAPQAPASAVTPAAKAATAITPVIASPGISRPETTSALKAPLTEPTPARPPEAGPTSSTVTKAPASALPAPDAGKPVSAVTAAMLPRVKIPLQIQAAIGRAPLPIALEPSGITGAALSIVVTGLPEPVKLSAGSRRDGGGWSLPLNSLAGLDMEIPKSAIGRHELRIELQAADGGAIAASRSMLLVADPAAPAMADLERLDEATLELLMKQAKRQLDAGQISAARLLLQRAAEGGNADAALQLGDTFDPARLFHMGARGLSGDMEKAIYWYERADELGAPQAKARLLALGGR